MAREMKSMIVSLAVGAALGLTICILFGVLDVQCYGTKKQNWNAELQACD